MMAGRFASTMIAMQARTGRRWGWAAEQAGVTAHLAGSSWRIMAGASRGVRGDGQRLLSVLARAGDAGGRRMWEGLERGKTATAPRGFQRHGQHRQGLCSTPKTGVGGEGEGRKRKKSHKGRDGEGGGGFDPFMFGIKMCVAGTFCYSAWATLPYAFDQVNNGMNLIRSPSPFFAAEGMRRVTNALNDPVKCRQVFGRRPGLGSGENDVTSGLVKHLGGDNEVARGEAITLSSRLCDLGCADCLRDAGAERVLEGMAAKGVDGAEALLIRVRA